MQNQQKFRLTHKDNKHNGVEYHEGLNEDPLPFEPSDDCRAGGMYYFTGDQLVHWRKWTKRNYWIWDVTLVSGPNGSQVYHEYGKSKTDKFILSNKRRFFGDETVCKVLGITDRIRGIKCDGDNIQFINNPRLEERIAAVTQDGQSIRFINNPTSEERLAAIKQNGFSIAFIKDPTLEEQLAAVKQNGCAINYIKNPSLEVRLATVK